MVKKVLIAITTPLNIDQITSFHVHLLYQKGIKMGTLLYI